ncbi:fungal-specific transcription factor domain-containing protein [Aspergillus falconensis]
MALRGSGGSCLNCRTRKVRCDRTLPQCSQCKQGSLECLVPEAPPRLLWLPIRTQGNFSLDQKQFELDMHSGGDLCSKQAQNADDLVCLTSGASIGAVLEQLDYLAEGVANGMSTSNGRFHAFRYDRTTDILTSPWSTELCISHELLVVSEHPEEADPHFQPSQQEWYFMESPISGTLLTLGPSVISPPDLEDFTNVYREAFARSLPKYNDNALRTSFSRVQNALGNLLRAECFKHPWRIAVTRNSSDAKVSLLFAVFAISAFRLDILGSPRHPGAEDWRTLGTMYRQRATKRLQMALRHLSTGLPKKEKYKNILMPLLSMVTICTVSGEMKNAAHYLRDIEQIIALYGIPKVQKSRRVQMLHSIYIYLRVLTEGTQVHKQSLRLDAKIYSIPVSLFKLILETTQLAKEVERLRRRRAKNTDHDRFAEKIKEHENRICEWEYYYKETTYPADPIGTPPLKERFPYRLTQAIYTALIIYFYRSVRGVNVITLQPYDPSSDICWPAFIAGCEATTPRSRQQITDWLEKSTNSNGILMFTVALRAIQEVWAARASPGNQDISWSVVLSESSNMRVLVLS